MLKQEIMLNKTNSFYSIAPMMGRTDAFFCYFMSLISKETLVYSEMLHSELINRTKILDSYDIIKDKSNIIIQVAGTEPNSLSKASRAIEKKGFKEVNINCGCPSPRVQSGKFGIILLTKPKIVRNCIAEIKKKTNLKISIKTRIGIEKHDNNLLDIFLNSLFKEGVDKFIIHARKAILKKISAKKNLYIPELDYQTVIEIKKKYKEKEIIINGGFNKTKYSNSFTKKIDGIMIGRAAYKNPWIFTSYENVNFERKLEYVNDYLKYINNYFLKTGFTNNPILHLQNIFNGHEGSKKWKQYINHTIKTKNMSCLFKFLKYNC